MARKCVAFLWLLAALVFPAPARDSSEGLLVYLPLATNFEDASGHSVPVKVNGDVRMEGEGAYFPGGAKDWIDLPNFDLHGKPFSISMWIKVTGKNPMYGLLYQHHSGEMNHWLHLMLRGGLQPYLGFYDNDAISPLAISPNQWTHLTFQYDGARQQLWVNGALLCSRESKAYDGIDGATHLGRSPNWNNVPSKNFEGFIRDFQIHDRALSGVEIRSAMGLHEGLRATNSTDALVTDPLLSNALAADVGVPFLDITGNKLLITGESKQVYEVRASSDLNAGFDLIGLATNVTGRVEFIDTNAAPGNRFYTLKLHR
jgi:hypothetical protein